MPTLHTKELVADLDALVAKGCSEQGLEPLMEVDPMTLRGEDPMGLDPLAGGEDMDHDERLVRLRQAIKGRGEFVSIGLGGKKDGGCNLG